MKKIILFIFCLAANSISIAQCDTAKKPIVFIHGFLASGDTYALQVQRFIEYGYCPDRLFIFDWNSVSGNGKKNDSLLENFIDSVLNLTGATQIDLVGHSAGGGLGRGYMIDSINAAKVEHYVHLGSRKWTYEYSWFKNSNCLNIYSKGDKVMNSMSGDVTGALNLDLKDKDHYEVATCEETFEAMYRHFNTDEKKKIASTEVNRIRKISGKAVYLGDNTPMKGAVINVYSLSMKKGTRSQAKPIASFSVDENGNWGSFTAIKNSHYEFELKPFSPEERTVSYFFEPFNKGNELLYLRGFPQGNMVGMMLGKLPAKKEQSAIVVFSANKAMIGGRDSLTVNGIAISSETLTPANRTIISTFIFDDGDGITSGKLLKQYANAPFIGGVDISLPVKNKKGNVIYYNGRKLVLPAISSEDRILLAVFQ